MKKEKNIGYKAMNSNMTCIGYQYKIGKTYKIEKGSELKICKNGFHFCFDVYDCLYHYNNLKGDKRFFKIQYDEVIIDGLGFGDKLGCTNKITILEEIDIFDYIRENIDKVNWNIISLCQKISENFIREFKDKVDWGSISANQKLSEDFIREFKDYVDWDEISSCQILSENFIREFKDYIDWEYISWCQILSENFIREFKDYVEWSSISSHQKLSEGFIREFKDKVIWYLISSYQTLSKKFKKEFKNKL